MTIALRVLIAIKHLKHAVDVGFVVGITAPMTPIGSATFWIPNDKSSDKTPHVYSLRYLL